MKIKIRYDNTIQTLTLNDIETEQLCVSLSVNTEGLSDTDKEKKIQEAFDIQYNRAEYNNWHKQNRHVDTDPHLKCMNGKRGYIVDDGESLGEDFFTQYADPAAVMPNFEYEEMCAFIKKHLNPRQADAVIAVVLDGVPLTEYAQKCGQAKSTISEKITVSLRKLKKFVKNPNN